MADVTVNIRGNADQLKREIDDVVDYNPIPNKKRKPPESYGGDDRGSNLPSNDRMIADIKKEMDDRGVVTKPGSRAMSKLITEYGQSQQGTINKAISERYDKKRDDLSGKLSGEYESIDERIKAERERSIVALGDKADDPMYRVPLDERLNQKTDQEYRRVGTEFDERIESLNKEEENEKTTAEKELTTAVKELTEYFSRQKEHGGDTFVGNLRDKQKALMLERDTATTEEGAMDAGKRLGDINSQLRRVLNGGQQSQGSSTSLLQGSQGLMGSMSSIGRGDIGGSAMGMTSAAVGLSGMKMATAAKVLGWVGALITAGKLVSSGNQTYEGLSTLAAYRSTSEGKSGRNASKYLGNLIPDATLAGRRSVADFGMDTDEFSAEATGRIRSRGTSANWKDETLRQIGLEKTFALSHGSLQQGGKFDRYGTNVTDAVTRLVDTLSQVKGSGVAKDDFVRVQERYDIQQQLMGSYMGRTDNPNYDKANQMLTAFSSVKGIQQDSRTGTDIQAFQSAIQNPMNDKMKALIFGSVADIMPKLKDEQGKNYSESDSGRMDKIDRAIINPENEGKIMQAVMKRITSQFGGTDTQMGYYAFKSIFPNIAPERMDAYQKQFSESGDPSNFLGSGIANQAQINQMSAHNKDAYALKSSEFITNTTAYQKTMMSDFKELMGKLGGIVSFNKPTENSTKKGGEK